MNLLHAFKLLSRSALAAPPEDGAADLDERCARLDAIVSLAGALKFAEAAKAARATRDRLISADAALLRLEELLEPPR